MRNIAIVTFFIFSGLSALIIVCCTQNPNTQFISTLQQNSSSIDKANSDYVGGTKNPKITEGTQIIWSGVVRSIKYQWTSNDLFVSYPSAIEEALFSDHVRRQVSTIRSANSKDTECEFNHSMSVLSIVGTILSFRDNSFVSCSGETYVEKRDSIITIDVSKKGDFYDYFENKIEQNKTGRAAQLTDFFSSQEIFMALMETQEIKSTLRFAQKYKDPKNLSELLRGIDEVGVDGIEGTGFTLNKESWSSFVFYKIEKEFVLIDVELKSRNVASSNPCLSLRLPIPSRLKMSLQLASSNAEGFLGVDGSSISSNQETQIVMTTIPRKKN